MTALIPLPAHLHQLDGELRLTELSGLFAPGVEPALLKRLQVLFPALPALTTAAVPALTVRETPVGEDGPEAYALRVGSDGLHLSGPPAGLARGAATLAQVLEQHPHILPALDIRDYPRFPHRGLMLDVSRHFMPLPEVKRLIDEMAALKLNVFHWHLTDDHGWRIEIQWYPKLTEVGAWRERTRRGHYSDDPAQFDDTPHGGFYTQDEIRELVAYAAERHISVIPELDLPGHSQAALAAYPELSCSGKAVPVGDNWGINEAVYCTRESTFAFLEGVLEEVMALFPSRTIHIGGDEVRTDHWESCPDCHAVMREQGFTAVRQLEGYFIGRMARFLTGKGWRVIGWDEMTEVNLPPGVQVMSWRGFEGGIHAARQGHQVIMTPQSHVYLDHYQGPKDREPLAIGGFSDLKKVYAFGPIPPQLSPDQAKLILGGQGNLWTEYIPDAGHAQYMIFPRLHAIAEVLWTPAEKRDWANFRQRLPAVLRGLEARGVRFRPLEN